MTSATKPLHPPRRSPAAHWVVILLAAAGAIAIQSAWRTALPQPELASWWPYVAAVIVASTAWLACAAWLHGQLARALGRNLRQRRLALTALTDLFVAACAALILLPGPDSRVLLAGLWIVPPTLLAASAASALVLLAAALRPCVAALRASQTPAFENPSSPLAADSWRTAITLALLITLGLLAAQPLPHFLAP